MAIVALPITFLSAVLRRSMQKKFIIKNREKMIRYTVREAMKGNEEAQQALMMLKMMEALQNGQMPEGACDMNCEHCHSHEKEDTSYIA